MTYINRFSPLLGIIVLLSACATPTRPTGGPPDKQGPQIVRTEPETGTVNFEGQKITLYFSEFVERRSLQRAIVVEPDVGLSYELDWGRKSVDIEFDSKIPDLTTLIVTIGTDLRDVHNNEMGSPVKVAVSTGPEIDEGKLHGKILQAQTGRGEQGERILLYRKPVDLSKKADYVAGTDTSGSFSFSYLREGTYKAFWVDDRNRNKIWDRERERAQPFGAEFVELEKAESDTLGRIHVVNPDTSRPKLQGVGLFSSRRMRMRFSEDITLSEKTRIRVQDSLGNAYSSVYPLYIPQADPFILMAHSENKLSVDDSYRLVVENISDLSGNTTPEASIDFTGSAQTDTTIQRIIRRKDKRGIHPHEPVEMVYAAPIANAVLRDSIKVVGGRRVVEPWPHIQINQNRIQVHPEDKWKEGLDYEIRFWNPSKGGFYKNVQPEIWFDNLLGALDISLEDTTNTETVTARLTSHESGITVDTTFQTDVEISGLPPVIYRLTLFVDRNGNGSWDIGSVDPYRPPEPYFVRRRVPVENSFTSELTISFKK